MKKLMGSGWVFFFISLYLNPIVQAQTQTPPPQGNHDVWIDQMVYFEPGSSLLTKESKKTLDTLFPMFSYDLAAKLFIEGYTDATESNPGELSLKRAEVVRDYFIKKGVSASRLKVESWGKERPIRTDDTPEGRMKNRRVDFKVGYP